DRPDIWKYKSMGWTHPRTFAVHRLRTRHYDLADGQVFLTDHLEHERSAERIYLHILGDLRHVTAVSRLMENNIDIFNCSGNRLSIPNIALEKFGFGVNPVRPASP